MKNRRKQRGMVCGLVLSLCAGLMPAYNQKHVLAASTAKQPQLTVSYDEVELKKVKMKKSDEKNYTYSAVVKNHSKKGTIKKIQYYYQIEILKKVTKKETVEVTETPVPTGTPVVTETPAPTEAPVVTETPAPTGTPSVAETPVPTGMPSVTETPVSTGIPAVTETPAVSGEPSVTGLSLKKAAKTKVVTVTTWVPKKKNVVFTAKNIKPGEASARISCMGDYSGKADGMVLKKVKLYAGEALYTYQAETKKETVTWGTKDKKAPVFSGWVGEESAYSGVALRVCYADRKNSYKFTDHVEVTDNRDGKVSFSVDTSEIKWDTEGVYKVYYTAKDKAGNEGKAWAKVQVYLKGTAESVADQVLGSIIDAGWSDEKKARAIYTYVKGHCSYTGEGSHLNWRERAVNGIRYQTGDCYTYYSMARLLLTRAGIINLEVTRYPGRPGHNHWWNLVYVKNGWYHLDTTPRKRDGKFCLVTYEQLLGYSSGSTFRHNQDILPKEATVKISPNP